MTDPSSSQRNFSEPMIEIGPYTLTEDSIETENEAVARQKKRTRERLENDTYIGSRDEIRWKSSNNLVPPHVFRRDANLSGVPAIQERENEQRLDEAIKQQRNSEPTAEQKMEMRSAFGERETVVNALTGQIHQT